jgi:hypothetical protein
MHISVVTEFMVSLQSSAVLRLVMHISVVTEFMISLQSSAVLRLVMHDPIGKKIERPRGTMLHAIGSFQAYWLQAKQAWDPRASSS